MGVKAFAQLGQGLVFEFRGHHRGRILFAARAPMVHPQVARRDLLDGVEDQVDQMIFGQPLAQVAGQKHRRLPIQINYLASVPALVVESAAQVNGPYTIETSAAVEPAIRSVTVPAGGVTRFYRLGWDRAVTITSINWAGGSVVLTYQ